MTDRTKLTLASLAIMMLPYRVQYVVAVAALAALGTVAYLAIKNSWRGPTDQLLFPDGESFGHAPVR